VNCVKCKLPIRSGEIAVRTDSQNMAHGQCANSANLSAQTPDRPKTRAIVDYQGLQYYADSIALDSDGKLIRGEAVPAKPQTIDVVEKIVDSVPHIDGTGRPGDVWLQTYLGRQLRVPEWNHDAICLEETAYVLSGIHRFGARTDPYYTVAEHSVRVADCIALLGGSALEQFVGINHEGDEALLGFDPASPLLRLLPDLKALKRLAHESYMRRYVLPVELPAIVKHADLVLLATEKRDLMNGGAFINMTEMPPALPAKIVPWPNPYARFVQRWRELAQAASYQGKE
jgi:hypothetical protein